MPANVRVLRRLDLIRLDDALLDAAGMLDPRILRSLDAVHLAAAQLIAPELDAVVTYAVRTRGHVTFQRRGSGALEIASTDLRFIARESD